MATEPELEAQEFFVIWSYFHSHRGLSPLLGVLRRPKTQPEMLDP
jgi:hypothetical protein